MSADMKLPNGLRWRIRQMRSLTWPYIAMITRGEAVLAVAGGTTPEAAQREAYRRWMEDNGDD